MRKDHGSQSEPIKLHGVEGLLAVECYRDVRVISLWIVRSHFYRLHLHVVLRL